MQWQQRVLDILRLYGQPIYSSCTASYSQQSIYHYVQTLCVCVLYVYTSCNLLYAHAEYNTRLYVYMYVGETLLQSEREIELFEAKVEVPLVIKLGETCAFDLILSLSRARKCTSFTLIKSVQKVLLERLKCLFNILQS